MKEHIKYSLMLWPQVSIIKYFDVRCKARAI